MVNHEDGEFLEPRHRGGVKVHAQHGAGQHNPEATALARRALQLNPPAVRVYHTLGD